MSFFGLFMRVFPNEVYTLRKLFKNPISERWGKQICLN